MRTVLSTSQRNVAQTVQRDTHNSSRANPTGQRNIAQTTAAAPNAGVQSGQPGKTNVAQTTAPANAGSPEGSRVAQADTQTHEASKPNTVTTKPNTVSPAQKPEPVVMASRPAVSSSKPSKTGKQKVPTFMSAWRSPDIGKKDKKGPQKSDTPAASLPPAPSSGFTTGASQYRVEYEPGLEMAASAVNKWAETAHKYAAGVVPPNSRGLASQPIPISIESRNKAPIVDGKPIDGICYGNRIVLYMPDNATITNSSVTSRDALVNIQQPSNSWSNNLAHETVHAILYRGDPNGTAWRQEGPGSLPYQAAENLTRDAHAAPQK